MNHQGRCSASQAVPLATTLLLLLLLLLPFVTIQAATFTVGGSSGWTFNVENWTDGKKFKAGDVLIFKYEPSLHNVVAVDVNGYKSCTAPPSSKIFSSGTDRVRLSKGHNYFICSIPGHCDGGLKIAVVAS